MPIESGENAGRYTEEEALSEAEKLQKKLSTGESPTYEDAEYDVKEEQREESQKKLNQLHEKRVYLSDETTWDGRTENGHPVETHYESSLAIDDKGNILEFQDHSNHIEPSASQLEGHDSQYKVPKEDAIDRLSKAEQKRTEHIAQLKREIKIAEENIEKMQALKKEIEELSQTG